MSEKTPRPFTIHVIDSYVDIHSAIRRKLVHALKPAPVEVLGFATPERYFNAVAPTQRPDVYVIANRHPGMDGPQLANRLREGFTGKIFIYTGAAESHMPASTPDIDGIFSKGQQDHEFYEAIAEAFLRVHGA